MNLKYVLFLMAILGALTMAAHAEDFNTLTGTTYNAADSAFRSEWDSSGDNLKIKSAAPGTAGATITWTDALTVTSAGRLQAQIADDTGTCTTVKKGRIKFDGVSSFSYCNGSA